MREHYMEMRLGVTVETLDADTVYSGFHSF